MKLLELTWFRVRFRVRVRVRVRVRIRVRIRPSMSEVSCVISRHFSCGES